MKTKTEAPEAGSKTFKTRKLKTGDAKNSKFEQNQRVIK